MPTTPLFHLLNTALYFPFSAAPFTKSPIPIPKSPNPNVVGYKDEVASPDVFRFTCLTFAKMTTASRKLGEFKPVDVSGKDGAFDSSNFYITFYDDLGAQRLVKNDTQLTTLYPALADDPDLSESVVMFAYKKGEGWYLADDFAMESFAYPVDDYLINDGDGFQVYANGFSFPSGVKFVCSGEVPNARTPIVAQPDVFAFSGNSTLKATTLGMLAPVDASGKGGMFDSSNFYITFYDDLGAQRLVKNDTQLTTLYPALAEDPDLSESAVMFAYKQGEGWYLADDFAMESFMYPVDEYVVNPGEGFQVYANGFSFPAGVKFDLPNALAPATEE